MELEYAAEEEELFQNINPDNYRDRQGSGEHNKTPGGYAKAWLNADRGRILGPSRSQEIQEGDNIEIGVFGTPMAIGGRSQKNQAESCDICPFGNGS